MVALAVAGATGAVGAETLRVLEKREFPFTSLRLFASQRTAQKNITLQFKGKHYPVESLQDADVRGIDMMLMSIGSKASRIYSPRIAGQGCVIIDNSSAYRMDPNVPLVVPEINAHALDRYHGIIANPNCTTAITLMALWPLHRAFTATRVAVASYQAASGAGEAGLRELEAQVEAYSGQTRVGTWKPKQYSDVFPQPIAFNVFPHIGTFLEGGSTDEEMKVLNEGRKIMSHPELQASTTCVRVPVKRVHCMDVLAQFEDEVSLAAAYEALRAMPGLDVFAGAEYPTPLQYAGVDNCAVCRVRMDQAFKNALRFWVLGDQLLKGAALNAVQIAEYLLARLK